MTRDMNETLLSLRCLASLISKWLKRREKYSRQRYLWTLCRSVVPWRCTTRFRPAVRLCQLEMVLRCFPIPCPRQDSEGEKSQPLDHMRQIPFVDTWVPPYWLKLRFSRVYANVVNLSSMWYVLRFEHAHGLRRYNARRMTRGQTTCSLGGTASLQLLLPYFILLTLLREKGRHSKSSVKADAIFLFLAIKSTLITVSCNENAPRLLLQQLRCYLLPPVVWWHQS